MSVEVQGPPRYALPVQPTVPPAGGAPPAQPMSREAARDGADELSGAMASFSAGWHLAELSELVDARAPVDPHGRTDASAEYGLLAMVDAGPGPLEKVWLSLQLVQGALEEVRRVAEVGAVDWLLGHTKEDPHGHAQDVRLGTLQEAVRSAEWRDEEGQPQPVPEPLRAQLRHALPRVHSSVLQCLYAANSRMGTAYALGVRLRTLDAAMDSICSRSSAVGTPHRLTLEAVERQLAQVQELVGGLKGLQQEHYAHPICQSIGTWRAVLGALPRSDRRRPLARSLPRDVGLAQRLRDQIHLWHRVLAGEAKGEQLLSLEAIVGIGCEGLRRLRRSTGRLLLALAPVLTVLLALGSGVVLLAVEHAEGSAVSTTALATFVTVIASAWKASAPARDRLVKIMDAHQTQLFGADVDRAVAQAITLIGAPPMWPVLRATRMRARVARLVG